MRYRGDDNKTRLNRNRDYANNISDKSKDSSNSNDNSRQQRRYKYEYNPDRCYRCKRLGHFKKDCFKMSRRTKSILEEKAKREMNKVNNVTRKEENQGSEKTEDENMGLNIQTQTKRNEKQMDKQQALSYLSQSTNPGQSRSRKSYLVMQFIRLKMENVYYMDTPEEMIIIVMN